MSEAADGTPEWPKYLYFPSSEKGQVSARLCWSAKELAKLLEFGWTLSLTEALGE